MSKKKNFFRNFLYDNRIILVFSILFAIIFWMFVALECSPEEVRVVENVPVVIDLKGSVPSQFGLQVFGTKDFTVDVTVVGKRYEVSSGELSANDFLATAQTSYVDSAGKHTLQVKVTSKDANADYQITGYTDESIEVYFDAYKESEYNLLAEIDGKDYIPTGYIMQDSIISTSKVVIGGPATEIAKIKNVVARVAVANPLTQTTTLKAEVIPMNEYGGTLKYLNIDSEAVDVTVTIPVLKVVEVETSVVFKNAPSDYLKTPLAYTCTPKRVKIGIPEASLDKSGKYSIGEIDFSELSKGKNAFTFDAKTVSGAVVLDDTKKFDVEMSVENVVEKNVMLDSKLVKISNIPSGYSLTITQSTPISVTVIGNEGSIPNIETSEVVATIVDPESVKSGTQSIKIKLYFKTSKDCWIHGIYDVAVNATSISSIFSE